MSIITRDIFIIFWTMSPRFNDGREGNAISARNPSFIFEEAWENNYDGSCRLPLLPLIPSGSLLD